MSRSYCCFDTTIATSRFLLRTTIGPSCAASNNAPKRRLASVNEISRTICLPASASDHDSIAKSTQQCSTIIGHSTPVRR